jgi:hypothetical protein
MSTSTNHVPKQIGDELAKRAETDGCEQCGCRFGQLLLYYFARTPSGLAVRCANCLVGVTPVATGACFGIVDPWITADRTWFAAHPQRRWRLRTPWPGELATLAHVIDLPIVGEGRRAAVAVRQFGPGRYEFHVVGIGTSDPLESFTDVGILWLVPELAAIKAPSEAEWTHWRRAREEFRRQMFGIVTGSKVFLTHEIEALS